MVDSLAWYGENTSKMTAMFSTFTKITFGQVRRMMGQKQSFVVNQGCGYIINIYNYTKHSLYVPLKRKTKCNVDSFWIL